MTMRRRARITVALAAMALAAFGGSYALVAREGVPQTAVSALPAAPAVMTGTIDTPATPSVAPETEATAAPAATPAATAAAEATPAPEEPAASSLQAPQPQTRTRAS